MKVRIKFRKYGALRFIGHLDLMRFFQKIMRKAEIPIAYSQGFNPHMVMSFASPLGIGITSDGEYLDIQLLAPVSSEEAIKRMNEVSIEGVEIISFRKIAEEKRMTGMSILAAADYHCQVRDYKTQECTSCFEEKIWQKMWAQFMAMGSIVVMKQTKRSIQEVNIRPQIYQTNLGVNGDVFLQLTAGSVENLKPNLVIKTFCEYHQLPLTDASFSYHRLEMYANIGERGERRLVSLESLGKDITL